MKNKKVSYDDGITFYIYMSFSQSDYDAIQYRKKKSTLMETL